jgi:hypothetical protein
MIKVIFYKDSGNFFDKLIRWWTYGPYSHCEIVINGVMYSADSRNNIVRKAYFMQDVSKWDEVTLNLPSAPIKAFLESQLGKEYDYIGIIFSQIFNLKFHNKNKWFCSELCAAALKTDLGILQSSQRIHPNKLYGIVQRYTNV